MDTYNLNMDAEVSARKANAGANSSDDIAAKINEFMAQSGADPQANPLVSEKLQRDLIYQRQVETLPQPDSAPPLQPDSTVELDRLEQMQRELEAAKAEATRWKKEFGRREGKVGGMEARIKELEQRVNSQVPTVDVRALTGRDPNEPLTGNEVVSLLMAQSQAFGNTIRQMREEVTANAVSPDQALPLDLEAELVEAHPWLNDIASRPQKMRAMHDILGQAGVTITPANPAPAPDANTSSLPAAAKTAVRQAAYIEPSNKGSLAEQRAVVPERQAFNEKMQQIQAIANGPYKPGQSDKLAELLASLGAGPVDDSQGAVLRRR